MLKKRNIIIGIFIAILIFLIIIVYKNIKIGNNINSKSQEDLLQDILNISSYEAKIEVTINSNKTTNKYKLKQYYLEPDYEKQVVLEPENIKDLEIIYKKNKLEIKNTTLNISKIYENYNYLNENLLWLNYIINNLKENNYTIEENEEEIILETNVKKYKQYLYINKENKMPNKIEIMDNNNNNKIYIQYIEIKLNNICDDNIF